MAWPVTLPNPIADGYSLQAGDAIVRTDMESGAARVRRRSTAAPDRIQLRFKMTLAQLNIFRAFWESDFLQGAAWVFVPIMDGRTGAVANKECRPTSQFKADMISGGYWMVTLPVEVRNA